MDIVKNFFSKKGRIWVFDGVFNIIFIFGTYYSVFGLSSLFDTRFEVIIMKSH